MGCFPNKTTNHWRSFTNEVAYLPATFFAASQALLNQSENLAI
jgi:hypothetical protein